MPCGNKFVLKKRIANTDNTLFKNRFAAVLTDFIKNQCIFIF